MLHGTAR